MSKRERVKKADDLGRRALTYVMAAAWVLCVSRSVSSGEGITGCCSKFGSAVANASEASGSPECSDDPAKHMRSCSWFRADADGTIVAWSTNGGLSWLDQAPPSWAREGIVR